MKKLVVILFAAATLVACKENKKTSEEAGEVAETTETSAKFAVDTEASTLGWSGSKVVSGSHTGTIKISEGTLSVEEGNLTAGNFTIDMTTINNTDVEEAEEKAKLEGHLKSADFFHVDSFATAKFEITKVEPIENGADGNTHNVSGNLTIKGNTREITFPAKVSMEGDKLTAKAATEINRLEWNVMWGNENDNAARAFLKENFLSNNIGLTIDLVAKK